MPKFFVYGIVSVSKFLGEYEAETKELAIEMAENDDDADWSVSLCHQCAKEVDIGDIYDIQADEID